MRRKINKKYRAFGKLPFYILFENKNKEKNVFLMNAELDFILPEMIDVNFLKNISNEDQTLWCFTRQANFLYGYFDHSDFAKGDYLWIKKMMLMKQLKGKHFLDGVIININLPKILLQTEKENEAYRLEIKSAIKSIYYQMKTEVAIHLVFTHCDRVAGFQEFFKYLKKEERDSPWGITFPDACTISEATRYFSDEYDNLMAGLNSVLPELLEVEKNQRARELLICFPAQMQLCKSIVADFVFHDEYSCVCSIYFVSHMQKGKPYDFLMSTIASKYDLPYSQMLESPLTEINFFNKKILKTIISWGAIH